MHGCRGNVQKVSQGLMAHFLCRPGAAMKLGAAGADRQLRAKTADSQTPAESIMLKFQLIAVKTIKVNHRFKSGRRCHRYRHLLIILALTPIARIVIPLFGCASCRRRVTCWHDPQLDRSIGAFVTGAIGRLRAVGTTRRTPSPHGHWLSFGRQRSTALRIENRQSRSPF